MTILKNPHKGKKLRVKFNGVEYDRYPVKTQLIGEGDDIVKLLSSELRSSVSKGDVILLAESALAAAQGRAYKFNEIKYGFWAKILSKFVTKTPAGIGLGTPETMQLAINEVGLLRIFFAAFISAISRPFKRGLFYKLAGEKARGIDGPTSGTIPPYNNYASLIPINIANFVEKAEKALGNAVKVIVIDANDIGVNILEPKNEEYKNLGEFLANDNPLGQGSESTPILFVKMVK